MTQYSSDIVLSAGMSVTEAALLHMEKMEITENLFDLANRSLNPSPNQIRWLRSQWVQRNVGGFDTASMIDMLKEYQKQNPDLTIQVTKFCFYKVTIIEHFKHDNFQEVLLVFLANIFLTFSIRLKMTAPCVLFL